MEHKCQKCGSRYWKLVSIIKETETETSQICNKCGNIMNTTTSER